jgi:hypothetical protein
MQKTFALHQVAGLMASDIWSEVPEHPRSAWLAEAMAGNTQLGYWDWVHHQIQADSNASASGAPAMSPIGALQKFLNTIQATGGLRLLANGEYTCAADEDWVDLADAALAAQATLQASGYPAELTIEVQDPEFFIPSGIE